MAIRSYRRFRAVEPRRTGRPVKSEDELSGTIVTQEFWHENRSLENQGLCCVRYQCHEAVHLSLSPHPSCRIREHDMAITTVVNASNSPGIGKGDEAAFPNAPRLSCQLKRLHPHARRACGMPHVGSYAL